MQCDRILQVIRLNGPDRGEDPDCTVPDRNAGLTHECTDRYRPTAGQYRGIPRYTAERMKGIRRWRRAGRAHEVASVGE